MKLLVLERDDVQSLVKSGVLSSECLAALEKITMMRQQQTRNKMTETVAQLPSSSKI